MFTMEEYEQTNKLVEQYTQQMNLLIKAKTFEEMHETFFSKFSYFPPVVTKPEPKK